MSNNKTAICVAKGDGIGPEIMEAVLHIFEAANVPLTYEFVDMGKSIFERGYSSGMTPEAKSAIESRGILFKGPMETPKGKGMKSINVTARKVWSTYANRRHFQTLHGVDTVYSKAGIPIDLTIVRENIEDTYGGIEHMLTHDVALARRIITRPGSLQVCRFAFEMARKEGYKKITCGHKANIMKLTDGLFLECFHEVAKDYPEIETSDIIVDDLAMKLVAKPHMFEVIVLTNLQGDILSDLCAGLVGGLGFAPSANIGDNISIFEAVHGTAPDIAGRKLANPTSLLLSGVSMLKHLGLFVSAAAIENALLYTLEQGIHTSDFGDKSIPALNTDEFAEAIIKNLGKTPEKSPVRKGAVDKLSYKEPVMPAQLKMTESPKKDRQELNGVDLFIESNQSPDEVARKVKSRLAEAFDLTTITNRGTQVWPNGSMFTECVNEYRIRIEKKPAYKTSQSELLAVMNLIACDFRLCSMEILCFYGEKKGYSLAQGQ
jgi:isocitrate dehydrogenase